MWNFEKLLFTVFQYRSDMTETLYRYAKFQYECGNYSGAAEYLYFVRVLVSLNLFPVWHISMYAHSATEDLIFEDIRQQIANDEQK